MVEKHWGNVSLWSQRCKCSPNLPSQQDIILFYILHVRARIQVQTIHLLDSLKSLVTISVRSQFKYRGDDIAK